jgi:hypothetical protein
MKNSKFKTNLLLKTSRDGKTAEVFHKKCDNKQHTMTFCKLENGNSIAAYTSKNWTSNEETVKDPDAMLFNLTKKLYFHAKDDICSGIRCD